MGSAVANASFYADFAALSGLKKNVQSKDPGAIRQVARQFESLFTDMMLKSMRAAKLGDALGDSQEGDVYQDMYDQQLAVQMSQGKGLGLADLLVQQLTQTRGLRSATSDDSSSGAAKASAAGAAAAPPAHGTAATARRIGFIQRLAPYARLAAAQLGVSPDSVIAQAALETGWGEHVPASADGASSNNLFGVKAGSGFRGASVSAATTEYGSSGPSVQPQSFRAYSSLQQGVDDYVNLLRRGTGYQAAVGSGDDIGAFASALQRGGYATDPDYAHKLAATAESVKALRASPTAGALKLPASVPITSNAQSV